MGSLLKRVSSVFFALLFAVFSINLTGVMSLQNAYAHHNPGHTGGGGTPAGNNGTIKIAEADAGEDESNANDPHVAGCEVNVKFFGYDAGPREASVTFEAKAPTENQLLSPLGAQDVSFTGSGVGGQLDHTETYTLAFTGDPQPQQGYHVKVTVHADGSQGNGTKHKTIWVEGCTTPAPIPTHPTFVNLCGTEDDSYTIPAAAAGTYYVVIKNYNIFAPKTVTAGGTFAGSGHIYIALYEKSAQWWKSDKKLDDWSRLFTNEPCNLPSEVTFDNPCGKKNDTISIPKWNLSSDYSYWFDLGAIDLPIGGGDHTSYGGKSFMHFNGGNVTIKAKNSLLKTVKTWPYEFTNESCGDVEGVVTGLDPANDPCGIEDDMFTIEAVENVAYLVSINGGLDEEIIPGTYNVNDANLAGDYSGGVASIEITAYALNGYTYNGQDSWSYEFTDEECSPCVEEENQDSQFRSAIDSLVMQDVICPGGSGNGGNGGGDILGESTDVSGIVLPNTSSSDEGTSNPIVTFLAIVMALVSTYGAAYYLGNRRNIVSEK